MRYRTILEQTVDEWEDGHGVVQIVTPEDADKLRRSLRPSSRKTSSNAAGVTVEMLTKVTDTERSSSK
jgi:hypothetical protein